MTFKDIETERIFLQIYTADDLTNISQTLTEDEVHLKLGLKSNEQINKHKEMNRQGYKSYNHSLVLIQLKLKSSGEIIGSCGYHNWNAEHRSAEIGYWLFNEEHKRKGYMSETLKAVLAFGFEKLNLNRVEAHIGKENIASQKLVKENSFVQEGCLRKNYLIGDEFHDSLIFALLENEYH